MADPYVKYCSEVRQRLVKSAIYRRFVAMLKSASNNTCQACDNVFLPIFLEVHHLDEFNPQRPGDYLDPSRAVDNCLNCHEIDTNKRRGSTKPPVDRIARKIKTLNAKKRRKNYHVR